MAIKIADEYPNSVAADADYPSGSFKNATTGTGLDGTPLEKKWANDWLGFFQALLAATGIIPSGVPDTAIASDYLTALLQLIRTQATDAVRGAVELATDAEMLTTDAVRAVTPARLRLGFSISRTADGYIALPTWLGGLIFQWGSIVTSTIGNEWIDLPFNIAFPTGVLTLNACFSGNNASDFRSIKVSDGAVAGDSLSGYHFALSTGSGSARVRWFAIGY